MMTRSLLIAGLALLGVGGVAASFAERRTRERETTKKKPLSSKVSFADGRTLSQGMISERMRTPVDLTGAFEPIPVAMAPAYKAAFGEDVTSIFDLAAIPTPVSPFQIVSVKVYTETEGGLPFTHYASLVDNTLEDVIGILKELELYADFLQDSTSAVVAMQLTVGDGAPFSMYQIELGYKSVNKTGSTTYFLKVQDVEKAAGRTVFASPYASINMPDVVRFFDARLFVAGPEGTIGALVAFGAMLEQEDGSSGKRLVVEGFHPDVAEAWDENLSLDAAIGTFLAQGLGVVVNLSEQAQYAVWDSVVQMFESNDPVFSTWTSYDGTMRISHGTTMALLSMIAPDIQWSEGTSLTPESREGKLYAGVKLLGTLAYQCTIAGY